MRTMPPRKVHDALSCELTARRLESLVRLTAVSISYVGCSEGHDAHSCYATLFAR